MQRVIGAAEVDAAARTHADPNILGQRPFALLLVGNDQIIVEDQLVLAEQIVARQYDRGA